MHDVRVLYGRCSDRVRDVLTPLGIVVTEPLLAVNPCQNKSGSNGQQSDHVTGWPAVLMFFCITGIKKRPQWKQQVAAVIANMCQPASTVILCTHGRGLVKQGWSNTIRRTGRTRYHHTRSKPLQAASWLPVGSCRHQVPPSIR